MFLASFCLICSELLDTSFVLSRGLVLMVFLVCACIAFPANMAGFSVRGSWHALDTCNAYAMKACSHVCSRFSPRLSDLDVGQAWPQNPKAKTDYIVPKSVQPVFIFIYSLYSLRLCFISVSPFSAVLQPAEECTMSARHYCS